MNPHRPPAIEERAELVGELGVEIMTRLELEAVAASAPFLDAALDRGRRLERLLEPLGVEDEHHFLAHGEVGTARQKETRPDSRRAHVKEPGRNRRPRGDLVAGPWAAGSMSDESASPSGSSASR